MPHTLFAYLLTTQILCANFDCPLSQPAEYLNVSQHDTEQETHPERESDSDSSSDYERSDAPPIANLISSELDFVRNCGPFTVGSNKSNSLFVNMVTGAGNTDTTPRDKRKPNFWVLTSYIKYTNDERHYLAVFTACLFSRLLYTEFAPEAFLSRNFKDNHSEATISSRVYAIYLKTGSPMHVLGGIAITARCQRQLTEITTEGLNCRIITLDDFYKDLPHISGMRPPRFTDWWNLTLDDSLEEAQS